MSAALQNALDLAMHGLLTELPAQLLSAAVAAAITAGMRTWSRRRKAPTTEPEGEAKSSGRV